MNVESYCLKGSCSSPRLLSLKWLGQGILEIGQRLDQLGAGHNQLYCLLFSSGE